MGKMDLQITGTENHTRNPYIDCTKGIAIILVVVGHSGFPYSDWIYLFHMALFFMCSGYCYTEKNNGIASWIRKKLQSLWLPNFISVAIVSASANILLDLHFYDADVINRFSMTNFAKDIAKALLFGGGESVIGGKLVS